MILYFQTRYSKSFQRGSHGFNLRRPTAGAFTPGRAAASIEARHGGCDGERAVEPARAGIEVGRVHNYKSRRGTLQVSDGLGSRRQLEG